MIVDSKSVRQIPVPTVYEARSKLSPIVIYSLKRYDSSMTRSKIAISLPKEQLVRVRREVRAGRADSVSGYISQALADQERKESLRDLLQDLIEQHGEPTSKDIKWAERVLPPPRG